MQNKVEVIWSEKFISGNREIDNYHKQIIDGVIEIYKMLDDSGKFREEIPVLTRKIEEALYTHMDIEIYYLKRFNLSWKEHEMSHNYYKKELEFYKDYSIPNVIRAVMTGEISREYMRKHFFQFDVKAIYLIDEKLREEGKTP